MKKYPLILLLTIALLQCQILVAKTFPLTDSETIEVMPIGKQKSMNIYLHLAPDNQSQAPILFVMHGTGRDADRYLAQWRALADQYQFNLIVPEFSKRDFAGSEGYNLGNLVSSRRKRHKKSRWSFSLIPKIFQYIKQKYHLTDDKFSIYGHSAGGQFVHRFVMAMPTADFDVAIAANSGWYTLPSTVVSWPYGLSGSPVKRSNLEKAFKKKLIILLGDKDTDTEHKHLRKTKEAMQQGPHRLARGKFFYLLAKKISQRQKLINNWELRTVAGADHNNALMAEPAAKLLRSLWNKNQ